MANLLVNGDTNDKIYKLSGFSDTVTSSFAATDAGSWGLSFDGTNLISVSWNVDKLFKHTGISATITTSFSTYQTDGRGAGFDGTNPMNSDTNGAIAQYVGFTSTLNASFSENGRDLSWKSSNLYSIDFTNTKHLQHTGFSGTIGSSYSASGLGTQGLEWDSPVSGTYLYSGGASKQYQQTGFTTTVNSSFVPTFDSATRGITWDDFRFSVSTSPAPPVATASAAGLLPKLSTRIGAPVATATAAAPAPTITAIQAGLQAPTATATASGLAPGLKVSIVAPVATATATAPAPGWGSTMRPPAATATATAFLPKLSVSIGAPVATAPASGPLPMVAISVVISATVATATAEAVATTLTTFAWERTTRGLRFDVYDAAGAKTNIGPLINITQFGYSQTLDKVGAFTMEIPADDPAAALLDYGHELWCFREMEGLAFKGIIHTLDINAQDRKLVISGGSSALKLVFANTYLGRVWENVSVATIYDVLLSGTGWTRDQTGTLNNTTGRADGATVWETLANIAKGVGAHLREDAVAKTVDIDVFGDDSGIRLTSPEILTPELTADGTVYPITSLRKKAVGTGLINCLIPLGAGEGINAFQMTRSSRTTPYTIQTMTAPDGRTIYYLKDTVSVTAHGERWKVVQWKDIIPANGSDAAHVNAANALYDAAATWLTKQNDGITTYEVGTVGLRHVEDFDTGGWHIRPGQKIWVEFRGYVNDEGGERLWLDVNEHLWLMGFDRDFDRGGADTWKLTVSSVDERVASGVETLVNDVHSLQLEGSAPKMYTTREMFGPEFDSIDSTHPTTVIVDLDNHVQYLHEAKLTFKIKALRSNLTGAASDGAVTSNSTGTHTHTVSGGTANSGGGQTSSNEATHTHTISSIIVPQENENSIAVWAGPGTYVTGTATTAPSPAATQDVSQGHVHVETGSTTQNQNQGHTHSLNSHYHEAQSYTLAAVGDHTHTVSSFSSGVGASHSHTVSDHTHTLSGITAANESSHTHTVPAHTHGMTWGIYEQAAPGSPAITVTINGVSRTVALGGPWNTDQTLDITSYLRDANGQPLRQANTIAMGCGTGVMNLYSYVKALVTASSI